MDISTQQDDKMFFIKVFIILTFLVLVVGTFFYTRNQKTEPLSQINQSMPLPKGFERDMKNEIPKLFPTGLVLEKDVVVVESFSQITPTTEEATYRYVSKLNFLDAYWMYSKYLKKNDYANTSQNQKTDYISGIFQKPIIKIIISASQIKGQPSGILEIIVVKSL